MPDQIRPVASKRAGVKSYDAIIVGAGVSGLLAAYELLRLRPASAVLLVDAGPPLERRGAQSATTGGYGGAGLYLGGRLYFGATSLPVMPPVTSPAWQRPALSGDAFVRRATEVDDLLRALGAQAEWQPRPPEPLERAIAQARAAGLDYITSYPSRRLSQQDKFVALGALRERLLAAGVRFLFGAHVEAPEREGDGFRLALSPSSADDGAGEIPAELRARALLLAPGRYGAEWLRDAAASLGARVEALPSAFGVRLETHASIYAPLTDVNPDPRLQRMTHDDALIKTYATCPGGLVAPIRRYGALVASGIPVMQPERRGGATTVAILAQPGVDGARGAWRDGEQAARILNQRSPDRLTVQRLGDVRRGQATTEEDLSANRVRPSDATALPGSLHDAYSAAYWRAFDDFIARLDQLAPGIDAEDTLIYGPAEERFWGFPTDELLQSTTPGLFMAGDGAGQSQGIIQASVCGLLAGEGMTRALG